MADLLRIAFIVVWSIGILGFVGSIIRYRGIRDQVELKKGPLPTPLGIFNFIVLAIIITQVGQLTYTGAGWTAVRLIGVGLGVYGIVMLPWTLATLKHLALPGAGVLRDHELVTSGPFRLVRHPLTSALLGLWLGTALGTLNWLLVALAPLFVGMAVIGVRAEEQLLTEKFGEEYELYAGHTPRFIPRPWAAARTAREERHGGRHQHGGSTG